MIEQFTRTSLILGEKGLSRLEACRVAVFGIGGVGGFAAEALVRAGIGAIDLIDRDVVDITNLNRQIMALHSTIGMEKVEAMKQRILDINPNIRVEGHKCFYLPETAHMFDFSQYDYIIDAVDTVTAKIELAVQARRAKTPIISSMGTGNKMDPSQFEIATIDKTAVCPLARVMRKELRQRGITDLKVIFSREQPQKQKERGVPGSISFVPSSAGLMMAGEVIKDLLNNEAGG